jgi:CubicO group peptidase (beta-lactamase class C family)
MLRPLPCSLLLLAACHGPRSAELSAAGPGFDPDRLQRVAALARATVEQGHYAGTSVLVLHDGEVVLEDAFGAADLSTGAPLRTDSIVRLYSMTKMVTAVAALQLVERGTVALDDPITRWLPELEGLEVCTGGTADAPLLEPQARPITVEMLLNHTAGFTYEFFTDSPVAELYARTDLWNAGSTADFLALVAQLPLVDQPGDDFHYGINDDVLGVLIERASGQPLDVYVDQQICAPLRLEDTFFDVPAAKLPRLAAEHGPGEGGLETIPPAFGSYAEAGRGFPCGGAGLFSTLRDYGRFLQCLLDGGELDGARILGRKTIELALVDSLPPGRNVYDPSRGWGLIAALQRAEPPSRELGSAGTFSWSGAATTHFFADPSERVIALFFAQHRPFDEHGVFPKFRTAVYQALR